MAAHIRKALPPKGGNNFYRDKSDRSALAKTLCGEPVTSTDLDITTGFNIAKHGVSRWPICEKCLNVVLIAEVQS